MTFNSARLIGPAIAGLTLAVFNEPVCFAINAVSYIAAIITLLKIRSAKPSVKRSSGSLLEALDYFRAFPPARWFVTTVAVTSICISPFMTFMPVYAKDIFKGGPDLLGTLLGASGAGALSVSIYIANRKSIEGSGKRIVLASLVGGMASICFAYNLFLSLALPLLLVSGGAFIMSVTSCNILLQTLVPENLRGRVMALYMMSFVGMLPIGSLLYGSLAKYIGSVKPVFVIAGVISLAYACLLIRVMPNIRKLSLEALNSDKLG